MWLNLLSLGVKTGAKIYQNKQRTKQLLSDAQMLHAEKMSKGEIEYKAKVIESNDNGWKDEFVLVIVSLPILVLAYAVFFGDDINMFAQLCNAKSITVEFPSLKIALCNLLLGISQNIAVVFVLILVSRFCWFFDNFKASVTSATPLASASIRLDKRRIGSGVICLVFCV